MDRAVGRRRLWAALLLGVVMAGCGPREEILPGERFGLRETDAAQEAFAELAERTDGNMPPALPEPEQPPRTIPQRPYAVTGEARAFSAGRARTNADWTHVNGAPEHAIAQPALGRPLARVWSAPIGEAATRRVRLTADPVVGGGRVYTMSAFSEVQATALSGAQVWRRDLTPPTERPGEASGGGLALDGGRLYVTTGYGRLHVLDAGSGAELWRQDLGAVANSAPTVAGGFVYLTTRDSRAWAIDAETGRILWQIEASPTSSVVIDGASPAVGGRAVIFPFGSGDVIAALRQGGVRLWSSSVTGRRVGRAYAEVTDITADPVIVGERVYIGTPTGRLAALDLTTGARLWTAAEGANSAVWPAGGSVFLVSDTAELVRLDAEDGTPIWSATLPLFANESVRRRGPVFAHFGPVLAGGRLVLASTDGLIREVDPASGQLLGEVALGAPAVANPVIAAGLLFVVTEDGRLHAFR